MCSSSVLLIASGVGAEVACLCEAAKDISLVSYCGGSTCSKWPAANRQLCAAFAWAGAVQGSCCCHPCSVLTMWLVFCFQLPSMRFEMLSD